MSRQAAVRRPAFALTELFAVLVLVGVLTAIILPRLVPPGEWWNGSDRLEAPRGLAEGGLGVGGALSTSRQIHRDLPAPEARYVSESALRAPQDDRAAD